MKNYLAKGDEVAAQGVFDDIPDNFNLDATQQSKYDLLTQFYSIRFNLEAADKTWFEMDATQYQTIQDLAVDSTSTAGMQSRAVLSLVDHITYPCYVPDIVVTPKSGYAGTYYEETFKVYPQEANDYFIIEYALAQDEKPEHTLINVYDETGKEMQSFALKTMANQFLSECGTWSEGKYWVYKEVDGAQTEQEPVFIKRGGDTTLESITGINELSLFPNPAQDYFFVQFNADSLENLEIQILDTQAKVLRHQNLTQRQMQIDTENWQSGVYIVNILQNGIVIDTAKMVVE